MDILKTNEFYSLWFGISGLLIWCLVMAHMPVMAVSNEKENKAYRKEIFLAVLCYIPLSFVMSFLLLKFDLIHFGTR